MGAQRGVESARVASAGDACTVGRWIAADPKHPFGIPAEEVVARPGRAPPGGCPIVIGPIRVGHIEIHQQVVDEVRDVEVLGEVRVGRVGRHPRTGNGEQLLPGCGVACNPLIRRARIVFFFFAAQVAGGECVVAFLANVVNSPVQAVDV